ncbi:MAG: TauD/TfdA family dioxygenase [Ilumatobacteraceae bacterium]
MSTSVDDASAWIASDVEDSDEWTWTWTADELDELQAAVEAVADRDVTTLKRVDFALPTIADKLVEVKRYLDEGRGFALLNGLPLHERFTEEQATKVYWAVGAHLGELLVAQNANGDHLGQITDLGFAGENRRRYATNEGGAFHSDPTDYVGLLCIHPAMYGGDSMVVSSTAVYNVILREHPEYAPLLYRPFPIDLRNEDMAGTSRWRPQPMFSYVDGHLSSVPHFGWAISAMRFTDVPRLTADELSALYFLESVAKRPEMILHMRMAAGDIQLVNNYTILHTRTTYIDDPDEPARRRRLVRLWMSNPSTGRVLCPEYHALRDGFGNAIAVA